MKNRGLAKPCRDYTGREFPSIEAMAAAWGIPSHVLYNRRGRDWPLEKALTTPVGHRKSGTVIDHTGKEYPSMAAMARAWCIDSNTLHLRLRYKWPLEKALTTPLRRHFSPVVDPESGVTYTLPGGAGPVGGSISGNDSPPDLRRVAAGAGGILWENVPHSRPRPSRSRVLVAV